MALYFNCDGNNFTNDGGFASFVAFVREADALKFDYYRLVDHVVGFVEEKHPEIEKTPYTSKSQFMEVFTFMSYMAGQVSNIGFITGVLALPQRQTALVAKQAAMVDLFTKGRFIMGVGIGYNSVEFQAMGAGFKDRAPRVEEQIDLLRALWTQPDVSFTGQWHEIIDVNVNPLPVQRPIPIYMGAGRKANPVPPQKVLERIGKYADGFMPLFRINASTGKLEDDALEALSVVRQVARDHGRDPSKLGLEISLYTEGKSDRQIKDEIDYLASIGATHIHARIAEGTLDAQLDYLRDFARIRDDYLAGR